MRRLRRINAVAATAFVVGGSLFALGAALAQADVGGPRLAARVYMVGGVFFTTGGYAAVLLVDQRAAQAARRRAAAAQWRWWAREPERLEWLSAVVLFVGTLVFAINLRRLVDRRPGAGPEDRLVWSPDIIGCLLFLISGFLAMVEISGTWLLCWSRRRDLGWWIVAVNQLGSVLFMVAGVASFVRADGGMSGGRDRQLGHPDRRPLLRRRRRHAGVRASLTA